MLIFFHTIFPDMEKLGINNRSPLEPNFYKPRVNLHKKTDFSFEHSRLKKWSSSGTLRGNPVHFLLRLLKLKLKLYQVLNVVFTL